MIHNFLRSLFKPNIITLGLREYRWMLGSLLILSIFTLPLSPEMIYASPLQTHDATEIKYHTVGIGDTLTKIARRYGVSVGAIQNANGLDDADFIWQGQKLRIPVLTMPSPDDVCVRYHRVEAGEVLSRIALNYGVTVQALLDVNNIRNADSVRSGSALCIPSNRPTAQAPNVAPTQAQSVPTQVPATSIPPTAVPTAVPTVAPTVVPTVAPTAVPTVVPTVAPTAVPTMVPTAVPTVAPTSASIQNATAQPTNVPSATEVPSPTKPLVTYRPSSNQQLQPTDYLYIKLAEDDTLAALADKYEVELDFLLYLNQIPATKEVEVGKTIVIPLYDDEADESVDTSNSEPDIYNIVKASSQTSGEPAEEPVKATALPITVPTKVAPTILPTEPPPTISPTKAPSNQTVLPAATPTPVSVLKLLGEFTVVGVEPDDGLALYGGEPNVAEDIMGQISPAQQALNGYAPVIIIDDVEWMFIGMETMGWVDSRYLTPSQGQIEPAAAARANEILFALRNQDMEQLAQFVHPEGVRFSPYSYLEQRDLVFMSSELSELPEDDNIYRWGIYDGSGEPIEMTWAEYYQSFIWSADFAFPDKVGYDNLISHSNMIDNHKWVYPESITIEYHFEGFDPQYGGLDWRSLRLVLEEVEGEWYLIAIINDQWTT